MTFFLDFAIQCLLKVIFFLCSKKSAIFKSGKQGYCLEDLLQLKLQLTFITVFLLTYDKADSTDFISDTGTKLRMI